MKAIGFTLALVVALLAGGCGTSATPSGQPSSVARFYLENTHGQGIHVVLPQSRVSVMLNPKPVITEGDIVNVELVQVDLGKCLMFQLTSAAARDYYRMSVTNQGRRLVLMLNGDAVGARRIDGPITDGVIYVFVEVPEVELPGLVTRLKETSVAVQREVRRKGE